MIEHNSRLLIDTVLGELESDAEVVLTIAQSLEAHVKSTSSSTRSQVLRERAALIKSAALALVIAAANAVGVTERLSIAASFAEVDESNRGVPPS